jgi:hypothetical protein
MVVYRFKFDQFTADEGKAEILINFLTSFLGEGDVINYKPSKRDVVFGIIKPSSFQSQLINWIKTKGTFNFEFETHSDEHRTLTQITMEKEKPVIAVCYLLPLFSVESYLDL